MTDKTMNTGDVSERMGIMVTAGMLTDQGFEPVGKMKRAVLWDQADYPAMCDAMAKYVAGRKNVPMPDPASKPKKDEPKAKAAASKNFDDEQEEL